MAIQFSKQTWRSGITLSFKVNFTFIDVDEKTGDIFRRNLTKEINSKKFLLTCCLLTFFRQYAEITSSFCTTLKLLTLVLRRNHLLSYHVEIAYFCTTSKLLTFVLRRNYLLLYYVEITFVLRRNYLLLYYVEITYFCITSKFLTFVPRRNCLLLYHVEITSFCITSKLLTFVRFGELSSSFRFFYKIYILITGEWK